MKTVRYFIALQIFALLFGFALWYGGAWVSPSNLGIAAGFWYVGSIFGFILGFSSRKDEREDLEEWLLKGQGFVIYCPKCTNILNDHRRQPKPTREF